MQNAWKLLVNIYKAHRSKQEQKATQEKEDKLKDQEVDVKTHLQIFQL
jgi:hypothetical protein